MRTMIKWLGAMAVAILGTAAVHAEDPALRSADHNGALEISRGDYAKAERVLAASLKVAPNDADLLLNRALLLQRTGRADEARAAFRQVLAVEDEAVVLSDGRSRNAHALAQAGLRSANTTVVAAR